LKIRRDTDSDAICIELSGAEARVLLDELSDVRGGARLPKLKQVCLGLATLLVPFEPQRKLSVVGKKL